MQQVIIISDDPGWHGAELRSAFAKHGLSSQFISLSDCIIQTEQTQSDVLLPDTEAKPLGIFVRGISGGSLEQIISRLNILHHFYDKGILVYNKPKAIERTVDKLSTNMILGAACLPILPTWLCEQKGRAQMILDQAIQQHQRLVLKPLFGSQGQGLRLLDNIDALRTDDAPAGGVYYLQQFIDAKENTHVDLRILVIDGIAQAAMSRSSEHWITNRAQGAKCTAYPLTPSICKIAEDACAAVDIDYAGVDLIKDQDGQLHILEINSMPAWYGLQKVTQKNIAHLLVQSFINHLSETPC